MTTRQDGDHFPLGPVPPETALDAEWIEPPQREEPDDVDRSLRMLAIVMLTGAIFGLGLIGWAVWRVWG